MEYFDSLEKNCKDLEKIQEKLTDIELNSMDRMIKSLDKMNRSFGSLQNDFLLLIGFGASCLIATVLLCWWFKMWLW